MVNEPGGLKVPISLGYIFEPPLYDGAPGGEGLRMLICRKEQAPFGLEQVRMTVVSRDEGLEDITIYHLNMMDI